MGSNGNHSTEDKDNPRKNKEIKDSKGETKQIDLLDAFDQINVKEEKDSIKGPFEKTKKG